MDDEDNVEHLDAIVIEHHSDGHSCSHKFERHLALLSEDLRRDPNNSRAVFYLAQTYRDIGNERHDQAKLELALEHYRRRAEMGMGGGGVLRPISGRRPQRRTGRLARGR